MKTSQEGGPRSPEKGETQHRAEWSWQHMRSFIEQLPSRDKYLAAAEKEGFVSTKLENKTHEENEQVATEIRSFLLNFFEEEETDTEEDFVTALENHFGDFFLIRDKKNEIIAFMNAQNAPVKDGEELIIWYVVTSPKHRSRGLASELYRNAYENMLEVAQAHKKEIVAVVGETDPEAEVFFNSMGRKRMYYKDESGELHEIPYMAPPSRPDESPSPEHFMVRFLDDRKTATKAEAEDLMNGIFAQYERPQYFEHLTKEGAEKYVETIRGVQTGIRSALNDSAQDIVYLYSKEERETIASRPV